VPALEISHYSVFGLQLASEIDLPELPRVPLPSGPVDVTIRRGPTPEALADPVVDSVLYQAAPGRLRLQVPNIATFLATDGTDVVVAPEPGTPPDEVRLFLYGSVLGAILQQRRILTLHASAITDGDRAVLFAGPSGHGKSTLAATFLDRGWRLLTDDVVAIRTDPDRGALAAAAYPEIKLWADSLHRLEIEAEGLRRVRQQLDKSYVSAAERFAADPVPVSHVYVLNSHNLDEFALTPVTGRTKLAFLIRNTYRRNFLDGLGGKDAHFEGCVALSQHAEIVSVVRPRAPFRIDELRRRIEADLERTPVS
jgi:hypothetical protein